MPGTVGREWCRRERPRPARTSASAVNTWRVAAKSSAIAISATASALRPGVCSTGMPAAVAPATSTLLGSPRVDATARNGRSNTGPPTESPSTTRISASFGRSPFGELLGGVDPQRTLLDPRVVDHVGQLVELVETRTAEGGRHERTKSGHDCTCWRTVTRVSAKEVTIGIDIGTTAVKAVAADEDGQVTARARIPHQLRVPAPDRLEHDADEAWRQGPLTALAELGRPDAAAVAVTAMVPSLTAVDVPGPAADAGPAVRGQPRPVGHRPRHRASCPVRRSSSCAGRRGGARRPRVLARDRGGQPCAGGRGDDRQRHRQHRLSVVRRHRLEREGLRRLRCDTGRRMPRVEMTGVGGGPGARHRRRAGGRRGRRGVRTDRRGADHDGDVLVLCGTTLIVWATIDEFREVPGLWTLPHPAPGKVPDRRAEQCRRTLPRMGGPPRRAWRSTSSRDVCRCGRRTCVVNACRFTIRIAAACSTG